MKYGLIGATGKLGKEVVNVFADHNHELMFTYDLNGEWIEKEPEIIIDASLPEVFNDSIKFVEQFNVPLIIATTGLTDDNLIELKKLSESYTVVQSYNFSVGIQVLLQLTKLANEKLPDWDVEISETHHRFKQDKPSGTAKMMQEIFGEKVVNTSSLRLGSVPGDHSVNFAGLGEVLSISHRATSRITFAEGILKSAEFAMKKESGLYSFTDVVFSK
ncbi:MAG: 4-hydroxy-tetrahydrodipicolinate reductase [Ignavibacteriaceae bacterium]|nr:4-hydroxy-tetrahydrodipicolinate reductase [Ignavibacteriaceae bacterium]